MAINAATKWAELQNNTKALNEFLDQMENNLISGIRTTERHLAKEISGIVADLENVGGLSQSARLKIYTDARKSLIDAVKNSHLSNHFADYINQYDQVADLSKGLFTAVDPAFAEFPKNIIKELKKRDMLLFQDLNVTATSRMDNIFLSSVLGGASKKGLAKDLQSLILGEYEWGTRRGLYEWHAGTYIRTYHRRFSRNIVKNQAREHGLRHFVYTGPVDANTRPFCLQIVGHTFTMQQIEDMDNGQTGDVFTDGGGYNCRHGWAPVTDEMAKEIGDESLAEDVVEDVEPEVKTPAKADWPEKPPRFKTKKEAKLFWERYLYNSYENTTMGQTSFGMPIRVNGYKDTISFSGLDLKIVQELTDEFYKLKKYFGDKIGYMNAVRMNAQSAMGPNTVAAITHTETAETHCQWFALNKTMLQNHAKLYDDIDEPFYNTWLRNDSSTKTLRGTFCHESIHWWQAGNYFDDAGNFLGWDGILVNSKYKRLCQSHLNKWVTYSKKKCAMARFEILKKYGVDVKKAGLDPSSEAGIRLLTDDRKLFDHLIEKKIMSENPPLIINNQIYQLTNIWKMHGTESQFTNASSSFGWFDETLSAYAQARGPYGSFGKVGQTPKEFAAELGAKINETRSMGWIPAELKTGLDEILPIDYLMMP